MENFKGRLLLEKDVNAEMIPFLRSLDSMVMLKGVLSCNRCMTRIKEDWQLPDGSYYCRACINLGRVRSSEKLYYMEQDAFPKKHYLKWQGELTSGQKAVSTELVENVSKQQNVLVHAVTGAGKTEMIYPLLDTILSEGKSIALVSPRIDVCIELHKRLKRDFSCAIPLLHGDSEPYFRSPLLVATCHQLFKFYHAFDVIIIDEVDAFPYRDDPLLYQAVEQSLKEMGQKVFLTATSTDHLKQLVRRGELVELNLARRFHGYPLVLPTCVWQGSYLKKLKKNQISPLVLDYIKAQRQTGFPLLIFCPIIEEGMRLAQVLSKAFPDERIACVSSQSEHRIRDVEAFRQGELSLLISTTILERGVTFPKVDVFIMNAHHKVYTASSLVQMSGRVGRDLQRPTGKLIFFHNGLTKDMIDAIKSIKLMNRIGGF